MKKNKKRLDKVLVYLVEEFIKNHETVSSKLICEKYIQDSSPATIRIDLNKLEKCNMIFQPHTSAGRIPTIHGFRYYLDLIKPDLDSICFNDADLLRNILIKHYKNTPLALHYIMQFLARETDQMSFVAEPQISSGYLQKLDVFKISHDKLLFVVSLDSGMDKTVIINCNHDITGKQLEAIVRYMNEEFIGLRLFDIQKKYIGELSEKITDENTILKLFLEELQNAFAEISSFFIHFDGSIKFLEQPEFDDKTSILNFLGFIQRQDHLVNLMEKADDGKEYHILLGEELGVPEMANFSYIYAKYEIFGIPGYLGILGPVRMDYQKYIPMIRDISKTITNTTKKGMMVLKNGK
ncbi:MAG: heat-inducible transcriptional repressor HrcA [Candidatus Cloacimonetes bacterium]|nr:heat-inducible transcriptional repressor HrcA [Candidatus Cloacimonadota bacterium]